MRLGYFITRSSWGGAEVYLDNLIRGVSRAYKQITIFCPARHPYVIGSKDKPANCELVIYGKNTAAISAVPDEPGYLARMWHKCVPLCVRKIISVYQINIAAQVFRDIRYYREIFKKHPLDLLHFNGVSYAQAIIAAKLEKIPVIIGTYHSLRPESDLTFIQKTLLKICFLCFNRAIAVSEAVKKSWRGITKNAVEKIQVIYNGIDTQPFENIENVSWLRKQLNIGALAPIVGMTARLEHEKGHRYLIEAASIVKSEIPNVIFIIVGDGSLRNELEESVRKLNLSDNFKFLGFRSDIPELTCLCDLSVLPSVSEALPYAVIEAMVCGKPVIGTRVGGMSEVIADGETGFVIEPKDIIALAKSIIKLLSNREKAKQMGEAGKKRVKQLFQRDRMIQETLDFYDRLLNKAGI